MLCSYWALTKSIILGTKYQLLKTHPPQDHFTHKTESPWPWHFQHSHWWKKAKPVQLRSPVRLRDQRSIYMWMQDGRKVYTDSCMASNGPRFIVTWTLFKRDRPNTKPGDRGTPNAHNRWFILFCHVWGPVWIKIKWNSIWLRAQSHMTSHYTWGSVTTKHNFGGGLRWPLDTLFRALTISWSQRLAHVWSGP